MITCFVNYFHHTVGKQNTILRLQSSEMWYCIIWYSGINSQEPAASICRVNLFSLWKDAPRCSKTLVPKDQTTWALIMKEHNHKTHCHEELTSHTIFYYKFYSYIQLPKCVRICLHRCTWLIPTVHWSRTAHSFLSTPFHERMDKVQNPNNTTCNISSLNKLMTN